MKSRLYLLSSILWLALIWISTSLPADEIPNLSVIGLDKLAHWGVFLVWAVLVRNFAMEKAYGGIILLLILALMLAIAALNEYHQNYIPGRDVSIYDLAANWAGLSMGWYGTGLWRRRG
jgi:VanZ family protein